MLKHLLPHKKSHRKSPFLSLPALLIYVLLFLLLKLSFVTVAKSYPGVLGVNSEINIAEVIEKTNQERVSQGLAPLTENSLLDAAAQEKAKNMLEENYWAHYAPSGKDPWGFINGAGYKFSYAGENLARNFYTSPDVVKAWMNSPTHRANILNGKYQEIGIAVVDGVLLGQKTTLVVQMFGRPIDGVAVSPEVPAAQVAGFKTSITPTPVIDPYKITKGFGLLVMGFISGLLLLDYIILRRRGVFRPSSHHFMHILFLVICCAMLIVSVGGAIL